MIKPHRQHPLWLAFWLHRVSGVVLALFLPVHFYVLALAIKGASELDGFLKFAELPMVKVAEALLVLLLAVHLFGGLRLMALEFLPWSARHKTLAAVSLAGGFTCACGFFFSAI